nr:phosphatase PAP2 family protein [uncultured Kingella sp.]
MNRTSAYALIALFTLLFVILFGGSSQLAAYRNPAPALMLTSSIAPIPATAFIYLSLPVFLVCAARRLNLAAQWLFFLLLTSELLIASVAYQLYPVHVDFTQPYTPQDGWQTLLRIAHTIGMSHNYLPSLHCAFATTAAAVLHGAIARPYRPLVWLYAAAINISTLTIHAHHLLDLLAGNLLVLLLWYPVRHWARRSFSGYQAHALWLHNQVQFARRHRRYALISLILYSQYLAHPKRSRLMIAGYCFLQAYDDIMDGDRALKGSLKNAITLQQHAADIMQQWQGYALRQPENGKYAFQAASDGAGAWGAGQPEKPLSDLPALADLFNQQLARLPSYAEAHAEVTRLLQLMQADAVRAQTRQLYPQAQLQRHLQQTFISSLNLLFHAQQSRTRAEHIPQLAHALAWCSITRDWDDDLAHGIINIPAEVWHAAALAADERDGRVISRNPVIAAWLAEQKQRAEQDLREVFFRLPQIKRQDPAAAQIIGLFARSVRGFARKRYPQRFGEGR